VIVVESAIRAEHGKEQADQLSKYYMALEIEKASDGMMAILEDNDFDYLKQLTIEDFCTELRTVASHVDPEKYRKNVRGPKKPVKKKPLNKRKPHISTAKVLAQRKKASN
jgi:hypothetical protein